MGKRQNLHGRRPNSASFRRHCNCRAPHKNKKGQLNLMTNNHEDWMRSSLFYPARMLNEPGGKGTAIRKRQGCWSGTVQYREPIFLPSELSLMVDREANWGENKRKIKELYFIISVVKMRQLKHIKFKYIVILSSYIWGFSGIMEQNGTKESSDLAFPR